MEANTLAIEPIQAAKPIQDYSEAELVSAAQAKDKGAFKLLYKAHLNRVYALCFRLCADKSLAEDATQEVFIQVWRKIENFNGDSLFTTWLHSLASNVTISHIRKQRGWWQKMMNIEDAGIEPFSDESVHCGNQLEGLIMRLPERARMVFVLHAIEGYRHNQVASMLDMAEGTSKAQYHRARTLLQEWMDE